MLFRISGRMFSFSNVSQAKPRHAKKEGGASETARERGRSRGRIATAAALASAAAVAAAWAPPHAGCGMTAAVAARVSAASVTGALLQNPPVFKPFVYIELPTPAGAAMNINSVPDVNDAGEVSCTFLVSGAERLFVWKDELDAWVGPLTYESATGVWSEIPGYASAINDDGEIAGDFANPNDDNKRYAFHLTPVTPADPAHPERYTRSVLNVANRYANDLNVDAEVVGSDVNETAGAFIGGSVVTLPSLSGSGSPYDRAAFGVNPAGGQVIYVAGQCETEHTPDPGSGNEDRAVVWEVDGTTPTIFDLTDPADTPGTAYIDRAWAVNDGADAVVARYYKQTFAEYKGYLCTLVDDDPMTWDRDALPTDLKDPRGINDNATQRRGSRRERVPLVRRRTPRPHRPLRGLADERHQPHDDALLHQRRRRDCRRPPHRLLRLLRLHRLQTRPLRRGQRRRARLPRDPLGHGGRCQRQLAHRLGRERQDAHRFARGRLRGRRRSLLPRHRRPAGRAVHHETAPHGRRRGSRGAHLPR